MSFIPYYLENDFGVMERRVLTVPYFVNTREFRREALYFEEQERKTGKGRYPCGEPGTREYDEYWDEQERRCIEGYTVGGVRITGDHYFYLNFCKIKLTKSNDDNSANFRKKAAAKIMAFPSFFDGDYMFYHLKEIARKNGKHLCIGKARRKGYSYKLGSIATHRMKMYAESTTVFIAFDKKYLFEKGKGIMVMATDNVDFINEYTAWSRSTLINQKDHIKDGYVQKIQGIDVEKGFKSEIMAISAGNNPDVARGKDGALVVFEESGKFPNLDAAYEATLPIVEDGGYVTGQIIMFGTGGGEDSNWEHFEGFFYNPQSSNFLCVENIWDEDTPQGSMCGLFIPDYLNKPPFIDEDGNSKIEEAKSFELKQREIKEKNAKSALDLIYYKMERPWNPREAFARSANTKFPVEELEAVLNKYKTTGEDLHYPKVKLERDEKGTVKTRLTNNPPCLSYPIKSGDDNSGVVTIYKSPYRDKDGKIPENLYYICHDPYDKDDSSGPSIGSAYVIENVNNTTFSKGDVIVASWNGRPASLDEYNHQLFMLAEFYNAKIGFENDRGDVIGYAKRFKKLHLLAEEFQLAYDDKLSGSKVRRGFGMHMGSGKDNIRKKMGDQYIADWLLTPRMTDEHGNVTLNLHLIPCRGLLLELIKYKDDKNYDRVSALRIGMYYRKEFEYGNRLPDVKGNSKSKKIARRLLQRIGK